MFSGLARTLAQPQTHLVTRAGRAGPVMTILFRLHLFVVQSADVRTEGQQSNLICSYFQGILVHTDSLPVPGVFGTNQSCNVSLPWTNQIFYYAIVAFDEKGNRGPISNLVTVYIHEPTTTTTVSSTTPDSSTLDPYIIIKYLKNKKFNESLDDDELFLRNISENLVELERSSSEIYMAVGIVCGVVTMIVILLISVVLITRRKRPVTPTASTTTSHTSQVNNI